MDIRRIDGPAGVWKPTDSTPRKPATPGKSGTKDRLEIGSGSEQSRNPGAGVTKLAGVQPEIREDRVEAVKENVESGFYNRPETIQNVANRMVDKGFVA